jgi:Protein of unknown function (DUF1045)
MSRTPINSLPRYAIYLAPKTDSALWQFGSSVLGYDAANGLQIDGFRLPSLLEGQWKVATARARNYGFHATLKAPFHLAEHYSEHDLIAGLNAFAAAQPPLKEIKLQLSVLDHNQSGGFLALTPENPYPQLQQLEAATVQQLDGFRAPLTEEQIAKRRPESLSERQRHYLAAYGYPYVLEEFRAHFTLSDRLPDARALALELNDLIIGHVGNPSIKVEELVLFKQPSLEERFKIIARAAMGSEQPK